MTTFAIINPTQTQNPEIRIYLNPNAPVECGTQTYLQIDDKYVPDIKMGNVYNRLIVYPANYWHSAIELFGKVIHEPIKKLLFRILFFKYCMALYNLL